MKLHDLLTHHGMTSNPFADEDAQTDPVFQRQLPRQHVSPELGQGLRRPDRTRRRRSCLAKRGPARRRMRLQMAAQIEQHNREHADRRAFVIEYDDFNPFLDRFADRLSGRKRRDPAKVLSEWKLWDHMDAILSLGVTSLVDRLLGASQPSGSAANGLPDDAVKRLDRFQKRDLLLLAACYDNSLTEAFQSRWYRLRRKLWYMPWQSWAVRGIGLTVKAAVLTYVFWWKRDWSLLLTVWPWLIMALGWAPWLAQVWRWWMHAYGVSRKMRCVTRDVNPLRQVFMQFSGRDINGQPLPNKDRTDDRYELLYKFQGLLQALGFHSIVVLVDRVDEPHLINGSLENMHGLVWSMLDNKFLKQPGLGLKLLLPIELGGIRRRREPRLLPTRTARQAEHDSLASMDGTIALTIWPTHGLRRARPPGKPNGEIDHQADEKLSGHSAQLRDLFDRSIDDSRLIEAFGSLRVPRQLFKFLYRVLVAHCQAHVDTAPKWQVDAATFEAQLALFQRDQQATDQVFAK